MENRNTVEKWQGRIILECEARLGRRLSDAEKFFITSRTALMALEAIEDRATTLTRDKLRAYLNSENKNK